MSQQAMCMWDNNTPSGLRRCEWWQPGVFICWKEEKKINNIHFLGFQGCRIESAVIFLRPHYSQGDSSRCNTSRVVHALYSLVTVFTSNIKTEGWFTMRFSFGEPFLSTGLQLPGSSAWWWLNFECYTQKHRNAVGLNIRGDNPNDERDAASTASKAEVTQTSHPPCKDIFHSFWTKS